LTDILLNSVRITVTQCADNYSLCIRQARCHMPAYNSSLPAGRRYTTIVL